MTPNDNLDPTVYFNGKPIEPAAVPADAVSIEKGEVVSSASPKVTLGPAKAVVATVAAAALGGLTALSTALLDERVTGAEWVTVAIATIVGSGIVGGATYLARTTVTGN